MKITQSIIAVALLGCFGCSDSLEVNPELTNTSEQNQHSICKKQAYLYASLFGNSITPNECFSKKSNKAKSISDISYLIENGDTLLYAVNFSDNNGYILLSGANTSFPILGHNDTGRLDFSYENSSSVCSFINYAKENAREQLHSGLNSEYFERWKDLGSDEYEYEIEIMQDIPNDTISISKRETSANKEFIYPYTGITLNWKQTGAYNYYAPKQACIGCPAIAIGMLLYDVQCRPTGTDVLTTIPEFSYTDKEDQSNLSTPINNTPKKLKEIADSIPNYKWGGEKGAVSSAKPDDVVLGLKKLGFKNAKLQDYNLDTLYNNICFKATSSNAKFYRGILIGAFSPLGGGHVWFCDGYYEAIYKVQKKKRKKVIKEWYEYDDFLYMNWGMTDIPNGWYSANDYYWNSKDNSNLSVFLKTDTKIITNLDYYESYLRPGTKTY